MKHENVAQIQLSKSLIFLKGALFSKLKPWLTRSSEILSTEAAETEEEI